jgi:hypothetical protein
MKSAVETASQIMKVLRTIRQPARQPRRGFHELSRGFIPGLAEIET